MQHSLETIISLFTKNIASGTNHLLSWKNKNNQTSCDDFMIILKSSLHQMLANNSPFSQIERKTICLRTEHDFVVR